MEFQEIQDKYNQAAMQYLQNWKATDVSRHIVDIIISVMMTRDNVMQGGGFVQAVCDNNLSRAVANADGECIKHIKLIALSYSQAFIK